MKRFRKLIFVLLALAALPFVGAMHRSINADRARLNLTHTAPLENAPPALAFTTVALGGFRGLIANGLWARAIRLQDQGNYFEMVSLSDWITKLQPDNSMVWAMQAWNMTYNISVQFENHADRWLWVRSGIELLRDQGMRYNPHSVDLYRELAWFFQDKIGSNTDYGHRVFKEAWATEMARVLGRPPRLDDLLNPQTDDARRRAKILREQYKLDPAVMTQVHEHYGPLDWRAPDAHAIYWAVLGAQECRNAADLMPLRRVIWQSMQRSFQRGRVIENATDQRFEFGPNLDIIPNAYRAYEEMKTHEPSNRDYISRGQRNFVADAIYFLYANSRKAEAAHWFGIAQTNFPGLTRPGASLDEFVVEHVTAQVDKGNLNRIVAVIEGLLGQHYYSLALGDEDRANGYALLARRVWERYQARHRASLKQLGLPSLAALQERVREQIREGQHGFSTALAARFRVDTSGHSQTNTPPTVRP